MQVSNDIWKKADNYSKKLFSLLTVKMDFLLKKEVNLVFIATWQALTSRMMCATILLNEMHSTGQNEKEILNSMTEFAIKFKNEHYNKIAQMGRIPSSKNDPS